MHSIIKILELILTCIVEISTIILELFGVAILVFTAVKCFLYWMKQDSRIRLDLAQGIALSLLRSILTFLIHWEIKHEEKALALDKTGSSDKEQ